MNYNESTVVSDLDLREAKFDNETMILYSGVFSLSKLIKVPECCNISALPSSLCTICNYAFKGCKIDTLSLPQSVKCIGHHAFHFSTVKQICLNEGLESIGYDAFKECRTLLEINLPNSLIEIGERAFRKCLSVKHFIIPPNVRTIGGGVFAGCKYSIIESQNKDYKIRDKCLFEVSTRKLLSCWSTNETISVLDGTNIIAKYAFDGMWFLREVFLPQSIIEIEEFAFEKGVKRIWVPKGELERFSAMANGRYKRLMIEY